MGIVSEENMAVTVTLKTMISKRIPRMMMRMQSRHCSNLVNFHLENDNQVAIITLNNPSKLNALTEPMGEALIKQVEEVKTKPNVRAAIITGAGKAFSAGGDLEWLLARHRDTPANNISVMQEFYRKFLVMRNLPVPVIAAINGPAVGAGLCLAVGGADIRVASSTARMGVTFTKLGLHPGMAATHFLPAVVGPQHAADLLLTGRLVTAEEALSMGLVARVADDALSVARQIAADLCTSAPVAVQTLVTTLREKGSSGLEAAYLREATAQSVCYPTRDLREGVIALQERRKPTFNGD